MNVMAGSSPARPSVAICRRAGVVVFAANDYPAQLRRRLEGSESRGAAKRQTALKAERTRGQHGLDAFPDGRCAIIERLPD